MEKSDYGGRTNPCVTAVSAWGRRGRIGPVALRGNRVSVSIFLSKRHRATSPLPRLKFISFLLYSSLVVYLYYFDFRRLALAIPILAKFILP